MLPATLVVAMIPLGWIRNDKAFLWKVQIVDFDTVQERLSSLQNDINIFVCRHDDIILFRRVQIQTIVGMIAMSMGYDNTEFLSLFSSFSSSLFMTFAALRVILHFTFVHLLMDDSFSMLL